MRKKYCPRCRMVSFSACKEVWICPYCHEDISKQPDYNINDISQQCGEIRAEEKGFKGGEDEGRRTA